MAAFKVGQRVRVVAGNGVSARYVGEEGAFLCYGSSLGLNMRTPDNCCVLLDRVRSGLSDGSFAVPDSNLISLLPPDEKADQLLARIKKLGSEPVNDAPKVTVREGK